jgi:2-dehydro-3-deoxyphosphogalactonate aldolase
MGGTMPTARWRDDIGDMPLVAILRGLTPDTALPVVGALLDAGFRAIEIPLNSPQPLESISRVVRAFDGRGIFGAGTVLTADDARAVLDTGARLIVAPNTDARVAAVARDAGALYCPGAMTPTEVFHALDCGAAFVKLFPAELIPPVGVKALKAVVPVGTGLFPVGGITVDTMADYRAAGADGFGLGSALFKPGMPANDVGLRAEAFVRAWSAKAASGDT